MIVVEEYFFVLPAWRDAFDARCARLAGLMAAQRGCNKVEVARAAHSAPSHLLWSVWVSLAAFRAWTRHNAFVLTASGALPVPCRRGKGPRVASIFAAPKQVKVNRVARAQGRGPLLAPENAPASRLPVTVYPEIAHVETRH
ncbi:MAG: antibiotic biosynthesis monooxygenase family protein [Pseudomonadota bacterium]